MGYQLEREVNALFIGVFYLSFKFCIKAGECVQRIVTEKSTFSIQGKLNDSKVKYILHSIAVYC